MNPPIVNPDIGSDDDDDGDPIIVNPPPSFNKDACKGGGWRNLRRADGSGFKNQGDCVGYASNGR